MGVIVKKDENYHFNILLHYLVGSFYELVVKVKMVTKICSDLSAPKYSPQFEEMLHDLELHAPDFSGTCKTSQGKTTEPNSALRKFRNYHAQRIFKNNSCFFMFFRFN